MIKIQKIETSFSLQLRTKLHLQGRNRGEEEVENDTLAEHVSSWHFLCSLEATRVAEHLQVNSLQSYQDACCTDVLGHFCPVQIDICLGKL